MPRTRSEAEADPDDQPDNPGNPEDDFFDVAIGDPNDPDDPDDPEEDDDSEEDDEDDEDDEEKKDDREDTEQDDGGFALTPARASRGVLDFRKSSARKLYGYATTKLSEELFACRPDQLFEFLESLASRADEYGWDDPHNPNSIMQVKVKGRRYNIIEKYGELDMDDIRAHERKYIFSKTRQAQDNAMLKKCLLESLDREAKNKVLIHKKEYLMQKPGMNPVVSANLLLKIIIRESHLDSNAKSSSIRRKLSSLDTYIGTIQSDITKFNQYVMLMVKALEARGETTTDLLVNLFKGYEAASDESFRDYIKRKRESYEDGEIDMDPERLMVAANERFKTLKESNEWNAPTAAQEKLNALQAKFDKLQKKTKQQEKQPGGNPVKMPTAKPDELKKKPSDIKKVISWNNRNWYWCCPENGGHCKGVWRCHKPSKCDPAYFEKRKKKGGQKQQPDTKKLKLAKAFAAIASGESKPGDYDLNNFV